MEIVYSEKELEDFLCKENNLEKYLGLKLIGRQIDIGVGILDILAYHRKSKTFVIIELKKKSIDLYAFEQCLRYKRKMENMYLFRHRFACLLIGTSLHQELNHIVERYRPGYGTINTDIPRYTLFNIDFDNPISFNWYSKEQNDIAMCHYGEGEI